MLFLFASPRADVPNPRSRNTTAAARTCVGQRLAVIEGVQILASIVKRYEFVVEPNPERGIRQMGDVTLGPKEGLPMRFTRRAGA